MINIQANTFEIFVNLVICIPLDHLPKIIQIFISGGIDLYIDYGNPWGLSQKSGIAPLHKD